MMTDGKLTEAAWNDLTVAKSKLEYPGLTARIADLVGKPAQSMFKFLPKEWNDKVLDIAQAALLKGLEFAILTMGEAEPRKANNWLHRLLVAGSGVAGGAVGLASLAVELPISTTIMLRSIADIARSEGHDLSSLDIKLSCLEVLAFGGRAASDDSAEEGYWVVRAALARAVSEASSYIAERGVAEKGAPALVRFVAAVASRFSTMVTEEAAATAIPVIGAVAGGTINFLFIYHFQEMARGHFIIRRLEKEYPPELIEEAYRALQI